jgi:hypothetical protein
MWRNQCHKTENDSEDSSDSEDSESYFPNLANLPGHMLLLMQLLLLQQVPFL